MSAIAWDLIDPLLYYLRQKQTRACSEALLDLVVIHGSKREVLLKLIEAAEHVNIEDDDEYEDDLYLLMKLLVAQDAILRTVSTKKPSRFLAEFTKSLLRALKKCKSRGISHQELLRYWHFVQESIEFNAIAYLCNRASELSADEQKTGHAIYQSFCTYVAEIIGTVGEQPRSYAYFEDTHPSLILRRPEKESNVQKAHPRDSLRSVEARLLEFCKFTDHEIALLFECGDWAIAEREQLEEEQKSEDGLEEADIPFSPPGSVILLSEYLHLPSSKKIDCSTPRRFLQCQTMLLELCASTTPELATLDSCVHCASYVVRQQSSKSLRCVDDELTLLFVQALSSISATCGQGQIRMAAHYAVRDMLKLTNDEFRFDFYLGTLQDCPFQSLKTVTVGMIKDELVAVSRFWRSEERLLRLTEFILVSEDDQVTEPIDTWVAHLTQIANFAIVLLSVTTSSRQHNLISGWLHRVETRVDGCDSGPESGLEILNMHLASLKVLLHA